jgi:hypothetical protein
MHSAGDGKLPSLLARADDMLVPGRLPPDSGLTSSYGPPQLAISKNRRSKGSQTYDSGLGRCIGWI